MLIFGCVQDAVRSVWRPLRFSLGKLGVSGRPDIFPDLGIGVAEFVGCDASDKAVLLVNAKDLAIQGAIEGVVV